MIAAVSSGAVYGFTTATVLACAAAIAAGITNRIDKRKQP